MQNLSFTYKLVVMSKKTKQISNLIYCDEFISDMNLETKLLPNPYHDYPYLIIKNFLSDSTCKKIRDYAYNATEVEKAKVKTTILNSVVDPSIDESIRKTIIHKLPDIYIELYEKKFKIHQSEIENFFNIALTLSTTCQALEYTKGSFYIKHADDSNELVNSNGDTVGFTQVAPQRKLTTVLFASSHTNDKDIKDGFRGGELMFNYLYDENKQAIKFCPQAGDMIVFPSNPIYSHEVLKVEDGYRLTLVQWHNAII